MLTSFPLCKSGRLPSGTTEIPFVFNLQGHSSRTLYETYHGVFINIQYFVRVDVKRGLLAKDLEKSCEFIVEYPDVISFIFLNDSVSFNTFFCQSKISEKSVSKPVDFVIVAESVHKLKSKYTVPNFRITGKIDFVVCSIRNAFAGEVQ